MGDGDLRLLFEKKYFFVLTIIRIIFGESLNICSVFYLAVLGLRRIALTL